VWNRATIVVGDGRRDDDIGARGAGDDGRVGAQAAHRLRRRGPRLGRQEGISPVSLSRLQTQPFLAGTDEQGLVASGLPVSLDQLRLLRISYWGFDKRTHLGQIVVNAAVVAPLRRVFATLFRARFP
jgi:hypothetical protein